MESMLIYFIANLFKFRKFSNLLHLNGLRFKVYGL